MKETKATAKAPANIAFIKYWGKRDERLRLPANSSISMNLSDAFTVTSVEFSEKFKSDSLSINGAEAKKDEVERVSKHLNLVRKISKIKDYARVISKNNFPKSSGIASSASGFAALTVASASSAGLSLSEKGLSILARLGSGSACRSIPDGFVEWKEGTTSESSFAYSLFKSDYWKICDVIAVVGENGKKISSTEGHAIAKSSPFYKARIAGMQSKIREIKSALKKRDFTKFGEILEAEAINMHAVMMTSNPPLYYWAPETIRLMTAVSDLRSCGLECYFTIDAGPNVHVICERKNVTRLKGEISRVQGVRKILVNRPASGAHLIKE